jgi:hypothetical protein
LALKLLFCPRVWTKGKFCSQGVFVSITDTHPLSPTGPVSLEALNAKAVCGTKDDCSELSENTRTVAISSIMPRLRAAMDLLERPCGHTTTPSLKIMEMLSGNISLLQESFMHTFYAKLQQLGVDASIKLSLRLNDDIRLVVAGEHPNKQVINELLSNDSELVESFAEIAAQSAALRDLRSLRALTMHDRASSAYSALAASSGECIYQLSLKGEMSHFYFTR